MNPSQKSHAAPNSSRRDFLKQVAAAPVLASTAVFDASARDQTDPATPPAPDAPWYRRALRYGQTNIAEIDTDRYDIPWWRKHWKRTQVQGIIVNAGGIFAYYPSKFPLHQRAPGIDKLDLFGELAKAAHDDGIAVIARMDSSKVHRDFFDAHPDWIGTQRRRPAPYQWRVLSHVHQQPLLHRIPPRTSCGEIIDRYHPERLRRQHLDRPRPPQPSAAAPTA